MPKIERKKRNKMIFAAISLTVLVVALVAVSTSGAWLTYNGIKAFEPQYSNFSVGSTVSFVNTNVETVAAPAADKLYLVNVTDLTAANYLARMKIAVTYQGKSAAYLRVKLIDEWTYNGNWELGTTPAVDTVLPNSATLKFDLNSTNWVDNRKKDGYYYYKLPIGNKVTTGSPLVIDETLQTIQFIDGFSGYSPNPEFIDAPGTEEPKKKNLKMRLGIKVEAVQFNRIAAFWGEEAAKLVTPYVNPVP